MALLKTINLDGVSAEALKKFRTRQAARAVVFDNDGKIGLLYVAKHNYHKLPGGGVETGEDILECLKRECQEELGCEIEVLVEIGTVVEYRREFLLNQESFCYKAKVQGDKGEPSFTEEETKKGFEVKWVTLNEAIDILENDQPKDYEGGFVRIRDLTFLKKAILI